MNESDLYIKELTEKLENIEDKELLILIKRLIEERNYLSEIVNIDALTGLNNKRILEHIREYSSVVMCDIDNFKNINDTLGHDTGDLVIKNIAKILKESTRSKDYICRFGGDEFLIAFVDCSDEIVYKRIQEIREKVTKNVKFSSFGDITMSFGISSSKNEPLDVLIKEADIALYESKNLGKNRITKYEKEKVKTK